MVWAYWKPSSEANEEVIFFDFDEERGTWMVTVAYGSFVYWDNALKNLILQGADGSKGDASEIAN